MTRQTGRRVLNAIATDLVASVATLSDVELRMLLRRVRSLTTTNCWWVEYAAGDVVEKIAKNEILFRRQQKRRERKAKA